MPIDLRWADESHSILIQMPIGKWTWEDFYTANNSITDRFNESAAKVDVIMDWSQTQHWPLNTIVHGRNLLKNAHPKQDITVFVGMNMVLSGMFKTFMQLNDAALKDMTILVANNVDDGLVLLAKHRQSA
jgi:hypothetical protein